MIRLHFPFYQPLISKIIIIKCIRLDSGNEYKMADLLFEGGATGGAPGGSFPALLLLFEGGGESFPALLFP